MIIGTAGHIDHGKTALVRALTGVDTDRLPEEKARGITIDLGYAYQPLDSGETLGFVDVPGHERLVHTMVAGAIGIDFVLLVVAADDGPMPQTHEHVQVLDLLGLARGAVALTKIDRVPVERASEASAEIRQFLSATGLAESPIFPVCALTGEGIGDLRHYLQDAARQTPARSGGERFRLAVDRSFTLMGIGTVVTGTVHNGSVRVGDRLLISPSGREARVRGIHAQNQPAECGEAGQRCALNLAGPDLHRQDIHRGDWVLDAALHVPTARLDVELRVLAAEEQPLRHWTPVHCHLGAADVTGRVAVLEGEAIAPGAAGLAQLVLDHPVAALHGDRFILRDQSASRTLGGGRVLDVAPPARGRRKPQRLELLRAFAHPNPVGGGAPGAGRGGAGTRSRHAGAALEPGTGGRGGAGGVTGGGDCAGFRRARRCFRRRAGRRCGTSCSPPSPPSTKTIPNGWDPTASACAASPRLLWRGRYSRPCSMAWSRKGALRGPARGCICRIIGSN